MFFDGPVLRWPCVVVVLGCLLASDTFIGSLERLVIPVRLLLQPWSSPAVFKAATH